MVETHTGVGIGGEGGGEVRAVYKHTQQEINTHKEVMNEEEGKRGRLWCASTHRSRR